RAIGPGGTALPGLDEHRRRDGARDECWRTLLPCRAVLPAVAMNQVSQLIIVDLEVPIMVWQSMIALPGATKTIPMRRRDESDGQGSTSSKTEPRWMRACRWVTNAPHCPELPIALLPSG